MFRYMFLLLFAVVPEMVAGQSSDRKQDDFKTLKASIWLHIWDRDSSDKSLKVDTIGYDDIPKYLDFRGTVVEALKWTDKLGDNILVLSVTGWFPWKDYDKEDSTIYMLQDKWELYAYLFRKGANEVNFRRAWKVYDYNECFGVDWFAGFIPNATTITDLDDDGIAEVSMPYVLICRGGVDPGTMKIIMYEGNEKYALRGETLIMCDTEFPYGGKYVQSENLTKEKDFKNFLIQRWNRYKCENGRFY